MAAKQTKQRAPAAKKRPAAKPMLRSAPAARKGNGADVQREVEALLYRQSEALDSKDWKAFIDLFTADGMYWMPPAPHYTTWDGAPSIFAEDRDMMTVRMKRVAHPHAWSQHPDWGTNHVVSNVVVEKVDPKSGDVHVRSRFHMVELRRDELRHFAGSYRHHLRRTKDGLRIKLQRVDMVNAQAPYEYVLQVWV
ncbi:MAG TPA: aromatic-ring-hydroxylating dioxygenase subunit beta [Burkholderiales bacterium]|nr:aromatic-ring-hydroxylating dioxygenase subunit beta [Burkholderiales bacterium]